MPFLKLSSRIPGSCFELGHRRLVSNTYILSYHEDPTFLKIGTVIFTIGTMIFTIGTVIFTIGTVIFTIGTVIFTI